MDAIKKHAPNAITLVRIVGTVWLLFLPVLSYGFFTVYIAAGLTDVLDGVIARKCGTESKAGATLDSIADLIYYAVMLIVMFPTMWKILPRIIWVLVLAIIFVRILSYVTVAVRFHTFSATHTYLNKLSGFFVFLIPFFIATKIGVAFCFSVCAVTGISTIEEFILHLTEKEYTSQHRSVFIKEQQRKKDL